MVDEQVNNTENRKINKEEDSVYKEVEEINKDISNAMTSLKTDELEKVKAQVKEEAINQYKAQQEQERIKAENEELKAKLATQQSQASETLEQLKSKVDNMTSSQQVVNNNNPFGDAGKANDVDNWTPEQVQKFDEASKKVFFNQRGN